MRYLIANKPTVLNGYSFSSVIQIYASFMKVTFFSLIFVIVFLNDLQVWSFSSANSTSILHYINCSGGWWLWRAEVWVHCNACCPPLGISTHALGCHWLWLKLCSSFLIGISLLLDTFPCYSVLIQKHVLEIWDQHPYYCCCCCCYSSYYYYFIWMTSEKPYDLVSFFSFSWMSEFSKSY